MGERWVKWWWRWWDGRLLSIGMLGFGLSSARINVLLLLLLIILIISPLIELNVIISR